FRHGAPLPPGVGLFNVLPKNYWSFPNSFGQSAAGLTIATLLQSDLLMLRSKGSSRKDFQGRRFDFLPRGEPQSSGKAPAAKSIPDEPKFPLVFRRFFRYGSAH